MLDSQVLSPKCLLLTFVETASILNLKTNILKTSVTTSSVSALSETEVAIFDTDNFFEEKIKNHI